MATIRKTIRVCDRCAFGNEKPATHNRIFSIGDFAYRIELCDVHADMFDRDMAGWERLAAITGEPMRKQSQFFTAERVAEGRRIAELRTRAAEQVAVETFAQKRRAEIDAEEERLAEQHARQSIPGALGWRLTNHARERMVQRGFTVAEVLHAAAQPDTVFIQPWRGPHTAIHQYGDCRAAVDTSTKKVITVIDRTSELEMTPPPVIATAREATSS